MRHFKKALFLLFACPQLGWSQINADPGDADGT